MTEITNKDIENLILQRKQEIGEQKLGSKNWGAVCGEQKLGSKNWGIINKINYNNKNNKIDEIDKTDIPHSVSLREGNICTQTPSSSFESTSLPDEDFIFGQESLDSREQRSGIGEDRQPKFRDYDQEIREIPQEHKLDVTYAKLSIWRKTKELLISLTYRNPVLYGNKLQYVQYSLTSSRYNFMHNLNTIWGPGTRKRTPYKQINTAMKSGVIVQAGKGRPKQGAGVKRRANLYPNSVCMIYSSVAEADDNPDITKINCWHNGVELTFVLDKTDYATKETANKPIATKEWRASEQYGR